MTENFIKESISLHYVALIVNDAGYTITKIEQDYGTDFIIMGQREYKDANGKKRYIDNGTLLKVQVKSTKKLKNKGTYWEYNLRRQNYNTYYVQKDNPYPFIFIIYKIPRMRNDWVKNDFFKLTVKKCAYYYIPNGDEIKTKNKTYVKIKIPKKNLFTKKNLKKIMEETFNE